MAEANASQERRSSTSRSKQRFSARDAAARVRDELPELIGQNVESVLGIQRDDDGGWAVTVAVVELARIPRSTDVLGTYEVTLDERGELIGYQRRRRYNRNQADED
ncbi:MAG TPA: gas vesicle protein GvpO [Solirubrobacteraceae bacterium]|nr:gas vesicle protein GvpO [Solirubrobacteraceae bacterium]